MMHAAPTTSAPWRRASSIAALERAAGCQQIVQDYHPVAGREGIGLHLDRVGPVFESVFIGNRRARQLAALAQHDETDAELERERGRHQEAAQFDSEQLVGCKRRDDSGEPVDRLAPGRGMGQQRGDVIEQDAWFGKIGYLADVFPEIHTRCFPSL